MSYRVRDLLRWLLLGSLLWVLLGSRTTQAVRSDNATPPGAYHAGELLVRFESATVQVQDEARGRQILRQYGAQQVETLVALQVERWRVPEGLEQEIAEALSALSGVVYAEPNYRVRALAAPNDPLYGQQWAHAKIGSEGAWALSTGSNTLIIAVLDTGVDLIHPEFHGKLTPGYNALDSTDPPQDNHGHGTHVAGIAGALGNNGIGVAGMAWQARIMPVKVLGGGGEGGHYQVAAGITYAADHGAQIINLSLGGPDGSSTLHNAVRYAYNRGVLIIAAAGNCGDGNYRTNGCDHENQPVYPAAYANEVLAVASTNSNDGVASSSNRGKYVDLAAPGVSILSTLPNGYGTGSGTSQAAPHVAGLAALLWSMDPSLTREQVNNVLKDTAVDLGPSGWDPDYGHGRINAGAALERLVSLIPPTLDPIHNAAQDGDYWVTWSSVPYATRYRLQEDTDPAFESPTLRYEGSSTQAMVTGRPVGTWHYRVQAYNAAGNSAWSASESTTVRPAAPTLYEIVADIEPGAYRLSWSSSTGATGYRLLEAPSDASDSAVVRYAGPDTSYRVTGQPAGVWAYQVEAYNQAGAGDLSETRTFSVSTSPIAAPTLDNIDNFDGNRIYTVTWTPVITDATYTLELSATPWFEAPIVVYSGPATHLAVTGQPAGLWHYRVRAHTPEGSSPWSNTRFVAVTGHVYLPTVIRAASAVVGQVALGR